MAANSSVNEQLECGGSCAGRERGFTLGYQKVVRLATQLAAEVGLIIIDSIVKLCSPIDGH